MVCAAVILLSTHTLVMECSVTCYWLTASHVSWWLVMIGWEGNYSADPPPPFPLTQASYFTVLSKWRPNFKKRRSLVSVQINFQKCSYVWFQLLKSVNNTITLRLIHPNHQKKSFGKKFKSVLSMSQNSVIILFYYIFMIV